MPVKQKYLRGVFAAAWTGLFSVMMLACMVPTIIEPDPTATPIPTPIPLAPVKVVVVCVDETPSYPEALFRSAVNKTADWAAQLVQPDQAGALIYVRYINSDSYADTSAAALTVTIPPIGPLPAPTVGISTPAPLHAQDAQTATVATRETRTAYGAQATAVADLVAAARAKVAPQLQKLRALPYNVNAPSDIWGCPQRATEIFADPQFGGQAHKYLVMASDMQSEGMQNQAVVRLHGVKVYVINFLCEDVYSCNSTRDYWTTNLLGAGATSVTFLGDQDTATTQQLFQ
jgi:hypothetical protein